MMKAGKNQVEIGKVLVKVGGRSFGDNVVDVGEHEVRGKASEDFVNKALEGGGGAGEPLSHALVLEETETGPKGSLFLGSVVEFNLVKAGKKVNGGEPMPTAFAESVGDVGEWVVVLGGDLVEGAQINNDAEGAVLFTHEHGARAEGAPARSDQLGLHLLVNNFLKSFSVLGALRADTDTRRRSGPNAVGRLKGWSGYRMANSVGISRGAAEARAMALEEVTNSGHLGRVRLHLGAKVDHVHQLVGGVLGLGADGRLPMLELSEGAELGDTDGVVVGVEDGERHSAIVGDAGDGGADEYVQPASDVVADTLEEDEGAWWHRGRDLHADDLLEALLRNGDVLGSKGERADGGGEGLRLEDPGRESRGVGGVSGGRRVSPEKARKRATNGGERGAKAARGVVVADLGGTEVDRGRSGVMKVIAENEGVEPLYDGNILDEELTVLDVNREVDAANDEAGTTDAPKFGVSDTVGDLAMVNIANAVGEIGAEHVAEGAAKESHGAARVGAVGKNIGGAAAGADGTLGEAGRTEELVKAVNDTRVVDSGAGGGVGGRSSGAREEAGRGSRAVGGSEELLDGVNPVAIPSSRRGEEGTLSATLDLSDAPCN